MEIKNHNFVYNKVSITISEGFTIQKKMKFMSYFNGFFLNWSNPSTSLISFSATSNCPVLMIKCMAVLPVNMKL